MFHLLYVRSYTECFAYTVNIFVKILFAASSRRSNLTGFSNKGVCWFIQRESPKGRFSSGDQRY